MMFFMMRGMHGGQGTGGHNEHQGHGDASDAGSETPARSASGQSRHPDGSHERIDNP